ncbi:MAG: methyltransferase domain-containing protein [Dehalococcoidia bacterium]|nr:methyltransferase domain-containing protein [Dehalococcoidia bacterium]
MRKFKSDELAETHGGDWLDGIKSAVKKYPNLYKFITQIISPVCPSIHHSYKDALALVSCENSRVINIGSGITSLNPAFINFDYYPYENVDIVGDVHKLPFPDNYFDAVINIVMLEHISEPEKAVNEMWRVLKQDGIIYSVAPFIVGFHASPGDFQRWAFPGIERLHKGFKKLDTGVFGGPTSGMLWIWQEWLAMLISFGVKPLYQFWYIVIMLLTWPIKYLDLLLVKHSAAMNIASSFYFIGRKCAEGEYLTGKST